MTTTTKFQCSNCFATYKRWAGVCTKCNQYSTIEEVESTSLEVRSEGMRTAARLPSTAAQGILSKGVKLERFSTQIAELDRVLGGGFVDSAVALLGGVPGAGKSTLSLRLAETFARAGHKVLYVSGEESAEQISLRAQRMGVNDPLIKLLHTSSLDETLGHIEAEQPGFFIVDSLQAVASSELSGALGSTQQSREAANVLNGAAKQIGARALLISQINKAGDFAGPEAIQHVVDVLLLLEGAQDSPLKFLRSMKNRFGRTDEVGLFQHTDTGLEEVPNPSEVLSDGDTNPLAPGVAYTVTSEGTRSLPVELQALVTESNMPNPRKQFSGVDRERCQIICAVLDKYCRARLFMDDVFVSSIFGVRVAGTVSDLAIAAAILSSKSEAPNEKKTAYVGELSLTGQVRGHQEIRSKIKAAAIGGFERIIVPNSALKSIRQNDFDAEIVGISSVKELPGLLGSQ